jgi:hypothetical protein
MSRTMPTNVSARVTGWRIPNREILRDDVFIRQDMRSNSVFIQVKAAHRQTLTSLANAPQYVRYAYILFFLFSDTNTSFGTKSKYICDLYF